MKEEEAVEEEEDEVTEENNGAELLRLKCCPWGVVPVALEALIFVLLLLL